MSKAPDNIVKLSETLSMCEYKSGGYAGFWLYDEIKGMNLSMRAKNESDAFVEALHYYQKRLAKVEQEYSAIRTKVEAFVSQFAEDSSEDA